jgi:hypothetical protein
MGRLIFVKLIQGPIVLDTSLLKNDPELLPVHHAFDPDAAELITEPDGVPNNQLTLFVLAMSSLLTPNHDPGPPSKSSEYPIIGEGVPYESMVACLLIDLTHPTSV